jgi:hypothetical protein
MPGLTKLCSTAKSDKLFDEIKLKLDNGEWHVNEKFITLMLESKNADGTPLLNDEMFTTFETTLYDMVPDKDATYDSMLTKLGDAEKAAPATINFYSKDFASKEASTTITRSAVRRQMLALARAFSSPEKNTRRSSTRTFSKFILLSSSPARPSRPNRVGTINCMLFIKSSCSIVTCNGLEIPFPFS